MRKPHLFGLLATLFPIILFSQNYAKKVDPFIGTGGHGHTYPGVSAPFGMIQLSPDSRLEGWDGCGGYHYSDSVIYGFSHTHLSGTGVSDYGDLLIMPFIGNNVWKNGYPSDQGYGSKFQHKNENAHAGFYSVLLEKHNIKVDLTTTERCGFHRYTYPKWEKKKVIIDLEHRDMLLGSDLILLNDSTLIGSRISKAWATEQHFYFTIQFSEKALKTTIKKDEKGNPLKMILEFGHAQSELRVKVGISAVDITGAKNNLKKEMPHWDFLSYQKDCEKSWNQELGKIDVSTADSRIETTFYTALYHSFLNPNLFSDVDGRYRGLDKNIHKTNTSKKYTVFSLWDTFRATHPLFTITQRERTIHFINTFLSQYNQGGIIPIWELSANYTGCMIGYHAIPVIVDAYIKGIRDFDTELALEAMMHSANQNHLGLHAYKSKGYISSEDESESVSKTLEYAYDDWCIAVFADSLGKDSIANHFYRRSQHYKNIIHPKSKFAQPRYNGGWKPGFLPEEVTFDYTEANSWQYSLFAPHDVEGLTKILGGKDSLEAWLDRLFTADSKTLGRHQVDITGLIGQYAHGNEPSHHMAYLYNFTNAPHKTQQYVNEILTNLYSDQPDGLSGNEDCGQMSSWYVLSSLGLYSFAPGSDTYLLGAPIIDEAILKLENEKVFKIQRKNYKKGQQYVSAIFLNGERLSRNYIHHHEILNGGNLTFEMSNQPSANLTSAPKSLVSKSLLIPSPYIGDPNPSFDQKRTVSIHSSYNGKGIIRYTTDGTIPNHKSKKYKKPIKIKEDTKISAIEFVDSSKSFPITANFKRVDSDWNIAIDAKYSNQYSAGGDRALIDQITGGTDFRTGPWQGYYDQDLVVTLNFNKIIKFSTFEMRFLQDIKSWVWLPKELEIQISEDGQNWFTIETLTHKLPIDQYGAIVHPLILKKEIKTQHLRIIARNRGECPSWHLGNGNPSWIFADEIFIRE